MKHLIERFFKLTTDEVFETFSRLPRAEVFKDFIFIPGTRDKPLLLVGHADIAGANPGGVNWRGNFASCGHKWTLITGPAYVGPKQSDPPPAKIETVPATTNLPAAAAAAAGQNPDPKATQVVAAAENAEEKGKKKGKKKKEEKQEEIIPSSFEWDSKMEQAFVVMGKERVHINEFRRRVEERNRTANSSGSSRSSSQSHNSGYNYGYNHNNNWNNNNNGRRNYGSTVLGADDRVGVAMVWMMRNSGHSILITDGEESGGRGAKAAAKTIADRLSQHQFAIEIDRMWDQEMVFYDVSTKEFEEYMQRLTGFRIEIGSYTDIADVCKAAGICGVNLAAGYWGQHTPSEVFNYDAWLRTLKYVRELCYEKKELPRFELKKKETPKQNPPTPSTTSTTSKSTTSTTNSTGSTSNAGTSRGAEAINLPLLNGQPPVLHNSTDAAKGSPSPYKDGPRFPEDRSIRTPEGTGIAVVQTRVDPNTHQVKTERKIVTGGDDLFPEGSLPVKQAITDAAHASQHGEDIGETAVGADEGTAAAERAGEGVPPILALQSMDVPVVH